MTAKKYDFNEILEEYNKKRRKNYKLSSLVHPTPIITHHLESNKFDVIFTILGGLKPKQRRSLSDFIFYYVSPLPRHSDIADIIRQREESLLKTEIKILLSNKIRYAYLKTNYFSETGKLGQSCMRYKSMQRALNFYVKNNVRIVVIVDNNGKIHARALLWDNVKSTKLKMPFTYLDRVYARSDTLCQLFYDLAKENKWRRYPSTSVNEMDKNYYKKGIVIAGVCHIPYNDTFRYLYPNDNLLTSSTKLNINKNSASPIILSEHTNCGYYPSLDPDRTQEAFTGAFISKKDAISIKRYKDNYDGYVLKGNIADINGDYYSTYDNDVLNSKLDGYILKKNSVSEIITQINIDKIKATHSTKYNGFIHKSNLICIENENYHKQDTNIICYDNKWYHISQCFINYNREKVNEEITKPVLTPKGNKEFVKHPMFSDKSLPGDYMQYLTFLWSFCREKGASITREDNLIPKEQAIIAYDIIYNPASDKILYQKVYCTNKRDTIQLVTGEFIIASSQNRKHLKKFNNKWYIKQDFKLPDKNQLIFDFKE